MSDRDQALQQTAEDLAAVEAQLHAAAIVLAHASFVLAGHFRAEGRKARDARRTKRQERRRAQESVS